ncbi:HET-domain-containing protein [Zopfia rhizophila CBS 207.26]|uniref:HET-domain-containing protein n=1 Tax=Zopfia rhizophila CBS 207.26 TaxID=1314779 RepID=A0A6A6DS01_9PEZI|nr:HET-domain-containing protein [Zopfia rhizophila CBS 207.26]
MPKRVIDVGRDTNNNIVYLCESDSHKGEYVVLSHRWSDKTKSVATTRANKQDRINAGIEIGSLTRAFQDAITVARKLHVRYLWIDSLCIVQNDEHDMRDEFCVMEQIYSSAYFTIAATSSECQRYGFLTRSANKDLELSVTGCEQTNFLCGCATTADFSKDVANTELNQRGWVYQERALSSRIIHFAATRTYWESECEVKCDSGSPGNILSRSNFPYERSGISTHGTTTVEENRAKVVFEEPFARYSQLGLSEPRDKSNAILGIEYRLAMFYWTSSVYGVFQTHFGRSLLWKRAKDKMVRITFHNQVVPTWLWMAYENPIDYVRVSPDFTEYRSKFNFDYKNIDDSKGNRCLLEVCLQK